MFLCVAMMRMNEASVMMTGVGTVPLQNTGETSDIDDRGQQQLSVPASAVTETNDHFFQNQRSSGPRDDGSLVTEKIHAAADDITIVIPEEPIASIQSRLEEIIVLRGNETSPLRNCSPTAQAKIKVTNDKWILQTIDCFGREKHIGGDEMYITYTDNNATSIEGDPPPTAVALIEDLSDGTYLLQFSTTPMNPDPTNLSGTGTLTMHFEYTCGIGMMHQPTKNNWKNSGATLETAHRENMPIPAAMKIFKPPQVDDIGQWKLVVFFGDSTMKMMIDDLEASTKSSTEGYGELAFLRPNTFFEKNIRTEFRLDRVQQIERKFQVYHRKQMLKYEFDVAIVLGSAVWDVLIPENIQGDGFEDHLAACREVIQHLRNTYRGRQLYWKSPSAIHMHRVNCTEAFYDYQECLDSTRYLSNSRIQSLHYKQKELMKELNVAYWDLFETYYLSDHYTAEGDGRHYTQELNEKILDWFYPNNKTLPIPV